MSYALECVISSKTRKGSWEANPNIALAERGEMSKENNKRFGCERFHACVWRVLRRTRFWHLKEEGCHAFRTPRLFCSVSPYSPIIGTIGPCEVFDKRCKRKDHGPNFAFVTQNRIIAFGFSFRRSSGISLRLPLHVTVIPSALTLATRNEWRVWAT